MSNEFEEDFATPQQTLKKKGEKKKPLKKRKSVSTGCFINDGESEESVAEDMRILDSIWAELALKEKNAGKKS